LASDLHLATTRMTTRLGHLLAPLAVRYIVIPVLSAPQGSGGVALPVPGDILAGLDQQTDLKAHRVDDALRVYENAAWVPGRALLPDDTAAAPGAATPAASQAAELAAAPAALAAGGPDSFSGPLPANGHVLVSESDQAGWHLSVAGRGAVRQRAFGWAMLFSTTDAGKGSLHFVAPLGGQALKVLEFALWLAAVAVLVADRRRRGHRDEPTPEVAALPEPASLEPLLHGGIALGHRKPRVTVPDTGDDSELWT
jgi:hypothetical protein